MQRKAWVVARREFRNTVLRPGWLISTFGMPLFIAVYAGVIFLITSVANEAERPSGRAGIVDEAGFLGQAAPESTEATIPQEALDAAADFGSRAGPLGGLVQSLVGGTTFVTFDERGKALEALARNEVDLVYVLPADYLDTGKVVAYDASTSFLSRGKQTSLPLRRYLVRNLAADRIDRRTLSRIVSPASIESMALQKDGTWTRRDLALIIGRLGVPLGFTILLMVSILVTSGTLMQGVGEEKENRVIEIILSSVDARSLLLGKLLGLGAAGLLQLTTWLSMALVPLLLLVAGLAMSPLLILLCLLYFAGAFLLFGTLITATGVLGTNSREVQQYGMFWSIACVVPMLFMEVVIREPLGVAARVLSYIPLTSPITMMVRIAAGGAPAWEVVLTLVLLALWVVVALRFAARVFRTAILLYGKRPTIPEVFRWMRQA